MSAQILVRPLTVHRLGCLHLTFGGRLEDHAANCDCGSPAKQHVAFLTGCGNKCQRHVNRVLRCNPGALVSPIILAEESE